MEATCREILGGRTRSGEPDLTRTVVEGEIALTLEHLDRSRNVTERALLQIDSDEIQVSNRLLNLRRLPYEIASDLWVKRDRIRNQLVNTRVALHTRKSTVILDHERHVQMLEGTLFELVKRHRHVTYDDGDKRNTHQT